MKLRYLTVLAVPAILGACSWTSSIDTQCKEDLCSTVMRNVGYSGDTFYTAVVKEGDKVIAAGFGTEPSPFVSIGSSLIVGAGIVKGSAAFAKGMAAAVPAIPAMPPMIP